MMIMDWIIWNLNTIRKSMLVIRQNWTEAFWSFQKAIFSGLFCRLSDKTELEALRFFRSAIEYTIIFGENVSWTDTPFTSIVDVYVDYSTQLTDELADELAHELIAELAD